MFWNYYPSQKTSQRATSSVGNCLIDVLRTGALPGLRRNGSNGFEAFCLCLKTPLLPNCCLHTHCYVLVGSWMKVTRIPQSWSSPEMGDHEVLELCPEQTLVLGVAVFLLFWDWVVGDGRLACQK